MHVTFLFLRNFYSFKFVFVGNDAYHVPIRQVTRYGSAFLQSVPNDLPEHSTINFYSYLLSFCARQGNYSSFSLLTKADATHLYRDFNSILGFFQPRSNCVLGDSFQMSTCLQLTEVMKKYQDYLAEKSDFDVFTSSVGPRCVRSVLKHFSAWFISVIRFTEEQKEKKQKENESSL